jgi:hypothetical protein
MQCDKLLSQPEEKVLLKRITQLMILWLHIVFGSFDEKRKEEEESKLDY